MAEHKHAAVLRAIADGKAVQWRLNSTWNDYVDGHPGCPLYCMDGTEWRIKPEPKPDVVRYVNVYGVSGVGELCKSDIEASANRSYTYGMASGMLRLTLSDNEGSYTLKSAEVLP